MRYGCDLEKAEIAGLLHDCAKHYSDETIIKKCLMEGLSLSEDERKAPAVLHAKYGAWLAKKKYNIQDEEVIGAIRWHTTGRPNMSLLEKIVFTADYIEPRRDKASNLPVVRPLAFTFTATKMRRNRFWPLIWIPPNPFPMRTEACLTWA